MCGRFTLMIEAEELQSELGLQEIPADYAPRYNIAPSQPIGVVVDWSARRMEWMRWGLVPSWAKDPSIGSKMINARSETIQEKPSFRNAFLRRRCLIPSDGFYEWQKPSGKGASAPYYFHTTDHHPFAFAGLWEFWRSPEGEDLRSCTILTTQANSLVAPVHERMPVMLHGDDMERWLGPGNPEVWMGLLKPFPAERMVVYPVSTNVNSPMRDGPDLVRPVNL
jgi:putative SOS response-associated peptidase YedK